MKAEEEGGAANASGPSFDAGTFANEKENSRGACASSICGSASENGATADSTFEGYRNTNEKVDAKTFTPLKSALKNTAATPMTTPPPPPPPPPPTSTGSKQSNTSGSSTGKKPFLKRGSRNWKRVEALAAKVERDKSAKSSVSANNNEQQQRNKDSYSNGFGGSDQDIVKVSKPRAANTPGERKPTNLGLKGPGSAPPPSSQAWDNAEDSALREFELLERQVALDNPPFTLTPHVAFHDGVDHFYNDEEHDLDLTEEENADLLELVDAIKYSERPSYKTSWFQSEKSAPQSDSFDEASLEEENDDDNKDDDELEGESKSVPIHVGNGRHVSPLVAHMFGALARQQPQQSQEVIVAETIRASSSPAFIHRTEIPKGKIKTHTQHKLSNTNAEALTEKLTAELKKFQASNKELQTALAKLADDQKKLASDRARFDRETSNAEREESELVKSLRQQVRDERAALNREKVKLERSKEHIEIIRASAKLERSEKGTTESLQATIAQLRLAEQAAKTKHKEAMQSKAERINDLETEVKQLQQSLRFAEERRLGLWEREKEAFQKRDEARAQSAALQKQVEELRAALEESLSKQQQQKQQVQVAAAKITPKQCGETRVLEEVASNIKDNRAKPELRICDKKKKPKHKGKLVESQEIAQDGTVTTLYQDGMCEEVTPCGESTVTFVNGDVMKTIPEKGVEIYFYAETNVTRSKHSDGVVIVEYPNGQIEQTMPDQSIEVYFPDGTVRIVKPDGSEERLFPSGTMETVTPDGEHLVSKLAAS